MKGLYYQIWLDAPAIFSVLQGEPNSAYSQDYVPGSVIRGLVIYASQAQANKADHDAITQQFFSDDICFLNANPVDLETNSRTLVAPLSWRRPKHGGGSIVDVALRANDEHSAVKMKSLKSYVVNQGQAVRLTSIAHVINVHNQRSRRKEDAPLVYRYDALDSGQLFEGRVLCQDDNQLAHLVQVFQRLGRVQIGRARGAGYGSVIFSLVEDGTDPDKAWVEGDYQTESIDHHGEHVHVFTLFSDVIGRNQDGEYRPDQETLRQIFASAGLSFTADQIVFASLDTVTVGGFNRKWGIHRPQVPAFAKGSVLVVKDLAADAGTLIRVLQQGIGDRRNEGFGRIGVNWQRALELMVESNKSAAAMPNFDGIPDVLPDHAENLWQRVTRYISEVRDERTFAADVYSDKRFQLHGEIKVAQLARLRYAIADELRKSDPKVSVVTDFLGDIQGKYAADEYEKARLGTVPLDRWLRSIIRDESVGSRQVLQFIDLVLERGQKERMVQRG